MVFFLMNEVNKIIKKKLREIQITILLTMCSFGLIHFSSALLSKLSDLYYNDKCLKIKIHFNKPRIAFAIFSFFFFHNIAFIVHLHILQVIYDFKDSLANWIYFKQYTKLLKLSNLFFVCFFFRLVSFTNMRQNR